MVRSIKGSLLDEVDVLTYSEYMQTLSSGYLQDTTNIQADPEVDAEVAMVREKHSFKYYDLSYLFNLFMKGCAYRR